MNTNLARWTSMDARKRLNRIIFAFVAACCLAGFALQAAGYDNTPKPDSCEMAWRTQYVYRDVPPLGLSHDAYIAQCHDGTNWIIHNHP